MNLITHRILCFLLLVAIFNTKATAQWDLFAEFLGQLDENQQNQFDFNLNEFGNFHADQTDLNHGLDGLFGSFNNSDCPPGQGLDSSYFSFLNSCLIGTEDLLIDNGIFGQDQDTLLGQISFVNDVFGNNYDSLGNTFGHYSDMVDDGPNWDIYVYDYENINDQSMGALRDTFDFVFDTTPANGLGDWANIVGGLFKASLFPDLELAFGTQKADLKYWEDHYSAKANVFRIGSVPRLDKTLLQCHDGILRIPIEGYWHWQGSFAQRDFPTFYDSETPYYEEPENEFSTLLMFMDYGMMANLALGRLGPTQFRVLTLLGIEAGVYAPAHRAYEPDITQGNKGFTTGWGPQLGTGFSAATGPLTMYSYATYCHGNILRTDLPYRYDSYRLEAGIRYNDLINVRYSTGKASWQPDENRQARVLHQVTVGVILDALHN